MLKTLALSSLLLFSIGPVVGQDVGQDTRLPPDPPGILIWKDADLPDFEIFPEDLDPSSIIRPYSQRVDHVELFVAEDLRLTPSQIIYSRTLTRLIHRELPMAENVVYAAAVIRQCARNHGFDEVHLRVEARQSEDGKWGYFFLIADRHGEFDRTGVEAYLEQRRILKEDLELFRLHLRHNR